MKKKEEKNEQLTHGLAEANKAVETHKKQNEAQKQEIE